MPAMTTTPTAAGSPSTDVRAELSACVGLLQEGVRAVIRSLYPEAPAPATLGKRLGLDAALAWSVMKVAGERSPFTAGLHVPGRRAFTRFIDGARAAGAQEGALAEATEAHAKFERLRRSVAGSTRELKTILSDLGLDDGPGHDLRCRRDAFRANSHLYGLQTRLGTDCKVLYPGERGVDLLSLRILADVRKLRRDAVCRLQFRASPAPDPSTGGATPGPQALALCAEDRAIGAGLLTEFCSRPLPTVEFRDGNPAVQTVRTEHPDLGAPSAATVTIALRYRDALSEEALRAGEGFTFAARSPMELSKHDVLVPRELLDEANPSFTLFSRASGPLGAYVYDPEDAMPSREGVEVWENALEAIAADCDPVYLGALTRCLEECGWEPERLALARVTMEYPVLNAIGRTVLFSPPGS